MSIAVDIPLNCVITQCTKLTRAVHPYIAAGQDSMTTKRNTAHDIISELCVGCYTKDM